MSSRTSGATDTQLRRLEPAQVAAYYNEGYLVLPKVFSPELINSFGAEADRLVREYAELIDSRNMRVRFNSNSSSGPPQFEVFDPIADLSPMARAIANDSQLLEILHDIYGQPACLFKDKLIYKPAGAAGMPLHQDWIAWPGFPESFLTVLVAIDPFTATSGATKVFPRMHQQGYLSPKDGQHHLLGADSWGQAPVILELEPGDIAMFGCFTPHVSEENRSSSSRRGYFLSYNALSDGGDQYDRHYREYHAWLRSRASNGAGDQLYFK